MSRASSDVNTYNSDGRIIQVEYAMKATLLGTTTIGVRLSDCVILVSEKKLTSKMQKPESICKHFKIFDRIVAGISGVSSDAPTLIEKCRDAAIQHYITYNEQIPVEKLVDGICSLALKFGEEKLENKIFSRPFGLSLLIASFDERPKLYTVDPSGSYLEHKANVIGAAEEAVLAVLTNEYNPDAERGDTIRWLLSILKNVVKDKVTSSNVDVSLVSKDGVLFLNPEQISEYL